MPGWSAERHLRLQVLRAVPPELLVISAVVLAASMLATRAVRRMALLHGVVDVPNARSSHSQLTPRGGGVSIVVATTVAVIALRLLRVLPGDLTQALLGGGTLVAVTGFLDDRRPMHAGVRLLLQFLAAFWALLWLGGLPAIRWGHQLVQLGWVGNLLALLAIVWTLNFFNFMDGIDGIAASEAIFVAGCGSWFTRLSGGTEGVSAVGAVLAAASAGFLVWNWPPATIFLGDVGSGYLGYVIGVLAVAATRAIPIGPWLWLILAGVFFVDATVTLIRRALRGERLHEAHRAHAYQWLARRWNSHGRVTLTVMGLNVFWLLPCALLAVHYPAWSAGLTAAALIPLTVAAIAAGSGRLERKDDRRAEAMH